MRKKVPVDYNATVQFRPGENLGKKLAELEKKWGISRHDAVRRMALLCAYELSLDDYVPLAEAASFLGRVHGFERACQIVNLAFHGGDSNVTPDPGIFTDSEKKKQFIHQVLCLATGRFNYARFFEGEEKRVEEEKQKQYVHNYRTEN